jgi:hypothetical protein
MFALHVCRKRCCDAGSTTSSSNSAEKTLVALAPIPLRPPTKRTRESSKFSPERNSPKMSDGM